MCHAKSFLPRGLCTSHSFCPECLSPASRWLSSLHWWAICEFSLFRGFQCSPAIPSLSPLLFFHVQHTRSPYCSSLVAQWPALCLCSLEHEPSEVRSCDCIAPAAPQCPVPLHPVQLWDIMRAHVKVGELIKSTLIIIIIIWSRVLELLEFLSLLLSSLVQTLTIRY